MKTTNTFLRLGTILLTTVTTLVACTSEEPASQSEPTPVSTAAIERFDPPALVRTGRVAPRFDASLAFQVSGRVAQRSVEPGDRVEAGETLMRIDAADFEQRLIAAQASETAAERALEKARNDLDRGRRLVETGAINEGEFESLQVARREAQSRLEEASANLEQARNALDYTRLEAPMAATVVDVHAAPGDVVSPSRPVVRLAEGDTVQLELTLPGDVEVPATGSAMVEGEEYPLTRFSAQQSVDPQSFTRTVRYSLPLDSDAVTFGTLVEARLPLSASDQSGRALTLPVTAIDRRGDQTRVWQVVEQKATTVPVSVIRVDTRQAVVEAESLEPGDKVVSHGVHRLTEGQAVKVVE
ncbi:efflux RND transporter periplasmic adaptor subunit [Spiribacter vilamensis]|uniref:RND family efflux transporter MFP subunit n=1 Tax=Spiribacter vilamensis TaxID=531306 RepID=A0A4Q8CZB4_9GAMM|nr:efflux RND transporter periplasmic adaptor subunit [Spiribacter vilamensis]RZU98314.1 RND family efflux transporter MFP subunit [Spiribacter vilamensis]TVO60797.1 efflux RND transporter periplasmic adaptor subunit [Spiribacter vilamensis]